VVRAREATAAQAASGHSEIATVFLHDHIRRHFRGTEQRVFALIDREGFGNSMLVGGVRVIPAGFEFLQGNGIWCVAIHFIRAHVHKGTFRARLSSGFEEVERTYGIRVEIIKGDRRRAVVRGLGRRVDDHRGLKVAKELQHPGAVADVKFVMHKPRQFFGEPMLVPARVALRPEENRALIVIYPMHGIAKFVGEVGANLRADQARGSGDEECFFHVFRELFRNAQIKMVPVGSSVGAIHHHP
jgi:hypothetical protein